MKTQVTSSVTKREFLRRTSLGLLGVLGLPVLPALADNVGNRPGKHQHFVGEDIFNRIIGKSETENWAKLPIGEVIGNVAMEFEGTPYRGFTLEVSEDTELCVVNLNSLDCVTFFENALGMARMIKRGKNTPGDLLEEIQLTRYRGGKMGDYTSRLHYTTDWLVDNQKKGVIKMLAPALPGAQPFTQKVGIMSEHPENYRQLRAHPEFVPKIRQIEEAINARSLMYLPMGKLEADEHLLQTGDIVCVATTEEGIDIAHTGLCMKDKEGVVHFMDASSSSRTMRVVLEGEISQRLNWSSKLTGVMFARPLELV